MNIGQKIKIRRTELKMSQRELSDKMGYSNHSTITKIENGQVDIPQSRIVQFAEVLGTTVPYLMDWEDPKEKAVEDDELSENIKQLIDFVKSVPEDKADLILRVMRSIVEDD